MIKLELYSVGLEKLYSEVMFRGVIQATSKQNRYMTPYEAEKIFARSVKKFLSDTFDDIKIYNSNVEFFNERTLFKINTDIDDEMYNIVVSDAIQDLKNKYEINFYMDGRSGRHITSDISLKAMTEYNNIVSDIKVKEQEIINLFNGI